MVKSKATNICIVCCNNSALDSYFKFPKNPSQKGKWMSFFEFQDGDINPYSRVCSRHFTEDDYTSVDKGGVIKRTLKRSRNKNPCPSKFPEKVKLTRKDRRTPCLVCGRKDGQGDRCYFNFPLHNEEICEKWANFCGVSLEEILPSHSLCSDHFRPEDIKGSTGFHKKRSLVEDAVPVIRVECISNSNGVIDMELDSFVQNSHSNGTIEIESDISVQNSYSNGTIEVETDSSVQNSLPNAPTTPQSNQNPVLLNTPTTSTYVPDVPKRLGDVRTPHLETPRRSKAVFSKAMDTISEKNKIIKVQNQKIKRLKERINTYKGLVAHLKEKNFISENAQAKLMVSGSVVDYV